MADYDTIALAKAALTKTAVEQAFASGDPHRILREGSYRGVTSIDGNGDFSWVAPSSYGSVAVSDVITNEQTAQNQRLTSLESTRLVKDQIKSTISSNTTITPSVVNQSEIYPVDARSGSLSLTLADGMQGTSILFKDEYGQCSAIVTVGITAFMEGVSKTFTIDSAHGWVRFIWDESSEYGYRVENSY